MEKKICAFFGLIFIMFSCMGESGDVWKYGSQAGVVRNDSGKYILLYSGDRVTSDALQGDDMKDGDCCLVDYKVNYGRPDSIESRYYKVDILKYEQVPRWNISSEVDTAGARKEESFLTLNVDNSLYVDGFLFVFPEYKRYYESQTDEFSVSFDPEQKPEQDDMTGMRYLDLYLRSTSVKNHGDTIYKSKVRLPQALHIAEMVSNAKSRGFITGDSLNLRLSYPEYFTEDSTSCGWRTSEVFTLLLNRKRKSF